MRVSVLLLAIGCMVSMALWLGGFTFYAGIVIPIMHEEFDSITGSAVTRRTTVQLNRIGIGTLVFWWIWTVFGLPEMHKG